MKNENQYHRHLANPPHSTLKDRLLEAYIRWDDYSPAQTEKAAKIIGFLTGGFFMLLVYVVFG